MGDVREYWYRGTQSWARLQTKGTVLIRWSSLQIAAENSGVFGATLDFDQLVTNFGVPASTLGFHDSLRRLPELTESSTLMITVLQIAKEYKLEELRRVKNCVDSKHKAFIPRHTLPSQLPYMTVAED